MFKVVLAAWADAEILRSSAFAGTDILFHEHGRSAIFLSNLGPDVPQLDTEDAIL